MGDNRPSGSAGFTHQRVDRRVGSQLIEVELMVQRIFLLLALMARARIRSLEPLRSEETIAKSQLGSRVRYSAVRALDNSRSIDLPLNPLP